MTLHCLFYSHVWTVHMLKNLKLGDWDKTVLVELAVNSNLAPVFGMQGKPRYGLSGMLRLGAKLEQLGQTYKYVPAPLLLAPQPNIPAAALCSAVGLTASSPSIYENVVLLVHVSEAPQFTDAYAYVNHFSIVWDIADPPTQSLVTLAEVLMANGCVSQESWKGFILYQHPNRVLADAQARRKALESVLQDYPLLAAR